MIFDSANDFVDVIKTSQKYHYRLAGHLETACSPICISSKSSKIERYARTRTRRMEGDLLVHQ